MPQLPAYATALGPTVAAVVALYVGRRGVTAQGVADQAGRLPKLPLLAGGAEGWPVLLAQWRERLQGLLAEFLQGHAAVAPAPHACDLCHLHMLCRIEPSRLRTDQSDAQESEQADQGAGSSEAFEGSNGSG